MVDLTHPFVDGMPLARFVTDAVTIDLSQRTPGPLSLAELEPHLAKIREGEIVLLHSDNARNYGTEAYWTGWSYHDEEAAHALIERGISAIGFDGPSADPVDSTTYDLHRIWLTAGRMIIENAPNLGELPERAPIVVAPLDVHALAAITATDPERVRSFGSILGTADVELAEPDATPAREARS